MPGIIYSLVARNNVVLAEHTDSSGNFVTVTQRILDRIPQGDSMMSYVYDKYIFHYIVSEGITYLCMADEQFGRRIPFAFLDNIKNRFVSSYGAHARTAMAYGMNAEFSRVLQIQMKYFSNDPGADRISQVKGEIDAVKTVMVENIEKVLERGERIELLVEKTETLHNNAFEFKKGSTKLKRAMWWKNMKITIILVIVIIVIVYIAVSLGCGWRFQKCIKKANEIADSTTSSSSTTASSITTGIANTVSTIASAINSASGASDSSGTGGTTATPASPPGA